MIRIILYAILFLLINACVSHKKAKIINVIVKGHFVNPQQTYDTLITDFTKSQLIDSLKIIGRPIQVPTLKIEIDTLAVNRYEISLSEIVKKIKTLKQSTKDRILNEVIINKTGQKIPLSAFSEIYFVAEYYKPEFFVPKPKVYYYKDEPVTKLEFYCKPENEKKLIELIKKYTPFTQLENHIDNQWEIEFID